MTGLRQRVRDARLPESAGEPELNAPDEDRVRDLVGKHLARKVGPPTQCTWEYARWKPGVSITCSYRVSWGAERERFVVCKKYKDGKERDLASKWKTKRVVQKACGPFAPWTTLPDEGLALWIYPADRMLGGLERLLDAQRFHRTLVEAGAVGDGLVRRRKTTFELLRYKPERRAVVRIDLRLRDEGKTRMRLVARLHPEEETQAIFERRRALEDCGAGRLVPSTVALDAKHGFLLEEWVDVHPSEPDAFDHAVHAGATLAKLHGLPKPSDSMRPAKPAFRGNHRELFALFADQLPLAALLLTPEPPLAPGPVTPSQVTWIHGDFHPDQVVRRKESHDWMLLDLDLLACGDPHEDLASWIADALFESPGATFREASSSLLEGYTGASQRSIDEPRLAALTAGALVDRAAGALRRCEREAVGRARYGLERSLAIAANGTSS